MATLQQRAEQIRDEVQEAANTAQRVGQLLIDLIALIKGADSRYLSGIRPDTAHAHIHFDQGLTSRGIQVQGTANVEGALSVGDFQAGMSGAGISADGTAEVERLTVRSKLEVAEMQINRLTAMEGDWLLTESGTVEHVEQRGAQWVLTMRRRFEGDFTAFAVHDVIKGIVSTAAVRAFRPNTPLPTPEAAIYAVAWLRVESVDINENSITCSLYDNADVPGGANMQPCEGMNLARWGNTSIAERRSCLYLSSREGRIVHLQGVTAPKITPENHRAAFGSLPDFLKKELAGVVDANDDYLFARGLVVQDIIRLDAKANPIPEIVDRGNWKKGAKYYGGTRNPETKRFEISDVWREGARWRCTTTKSKGTTEPPTPNSIHWTLIQAKPKDGDAGKSAPPTGANLIDGTSFRSMEEVRRWENFDRFTFDTSQTDRVHPLAQAVCALKDLNWIKGSLKIAGLLRPNTTYTISIYSKGAGGILAVQAISKEVNRYISCPNVDRQKWTRYAYTFTTPETIPDNAHIFLGAWDMLAKTYFSALKLEEGEEATAWCLSENDKTGTPAANPNLWHCTDYVTRPHFTKGYLDRPYASILPGGVDGDNYFHIEGNNEEREAHVMDAPFGNRYPRGTWYTISFKCRGSGAARFHCYPGGWKKNRFYFPRIKKDGIDGIGQGYLILYFRLTKEWVTHSLSFFYDEEEDDLPKNLRTLFSLPKSEGNYLDICHPKMETGELATPWCLSEMDKKGERGNDGKNSYTHVAYSNSPDGNPCTLDPKGEKFAYLGTYTDEKKTASTDHARYVWAKVQGDKGDKGRGVSRMRAFYMLTAESDAPQRDTSGWEEAAPQPTKECPWLWSYERSEYTDGTADQTEVRLIGHYGKDGTNGTSIRAQYSADALTWHDDFAEGDVWMRTGNGTTWGGALRVVGESGADGKSPVYDFAASSQLATASSTTAPTIRGTWQDAPPALREGEVLWYRLTAANGKITYGRLSGEKGRNSYTHIAYANSADGAEDFTMEEDLGRGGEIEFSYFGIYADFDESASQDYHDYVWTRLRGVDGKDGLTPNANLLDDTDFKNLGRKESAWKIGTRGEEPIAGSANISIFSSAVDGCVPALCAINPGTKDGEYAQLFQNVGQLIPGRTYTFSAYVRGADVAWLIVYPTPAEHFHPNTVKQDGWTRVSLTFRAPAVQDPDGVLLLLRAWHRETTPHTGYAKSVVWCAPKLEEGDRATQWCPSFRDQRGADGSPGVRGAAVRLLGDYDRLADGTTFESGHAGETYLDVVQVRQGEQVQFYQCKQPHAKSADKAPAADSEWWELGTYQGFVATDLLLARRSLIKNLQVENVVGRDKRGNATFELDAETGAAYIGGTATFAGFIRRRPVVITPENWKEYGGEIGRNGDVFYLNPFSVGTYVIFRGDFGALRPTIDTSNDPLGEGRAEHTEDNSHLMRYYGAQFMVFNDTPTSLFIGGVKIFQKGTAVFTMLGRNRENPTLWWKGELVGSW